MEKKDYFPDSLIRLREFLELQIAQWPDKGALLGLTPAQITAKVAQCQAQLDAVNTVLQMQANTAEAVEKRNLGARAFEDEYRLDVKRYKLLPNVDPSVFKAFGWVGDEQGKPDLNSVAPDIKHIEVLPGEVHLDFVRRGMDGVDAEYSFTGNDGWTKGDFDNRSPYEDKRPLRTPGTPEMRYYRFRFRYKGEPVGQYSEVVSALFRG